MPTSDPTRSMRGSERKSEAAHKGVEDGDGVASEAGERRPLTAKLVGAVDVTLAYRKQLAAGERRSSEKANAYPSQAGMPQQAMRQAFSDSTARAAERGAATRSVWGRERKRAGGHVRPGVSVLEGLAVLEGVVEGLAVRVSVIEELIVRVSVLGGLTVRDSELEGLAVLEEEGMAVEVGELERVMLEDGVLDTVSAGDGIYRFDGRQGSAMPDDAQAGPSAWP